MENYSTTHTDALGTVHYVDGSKRWHRTDGPALEHKDGGKYWYIHGKRHREDGPAIIRASGSTAWYLDDKRHREDGPAVKHGAGEAFYYYGQVAESSKQFYDDNWRKEILLRQVK